MKIKFEEENLRRKIWNLEIHSKDLLLGRTFSNNNMVMIIIYHNQLKIIYFTHDLSVNLFSDWESSISHVCKPIAWILVNAFVPSNLLTFRIFFVYFPFLLLFPTLFSVADNSYDIWRRSIQHVSFFFIILMKFFTSIIFTSLSSIFISVHFTFSYIFKAYQLLLSIRRSNLRSHKSTHPTQTRFQKTFLN